MLGSKHKVLTLRARDSQNLHCHAGTVLGGNSEIQQVAENQN